MQTETPIPVSMPRYLLRFRVEDWAPLVGPEPQDWGGGRLGTHWTIFRARSMYMQARSEWRRRQRLTVERRPTEVSGVPAAHLVE